jgi:hypothetical protein
MMAGIGAAGSTPATPAPVPVEAPPALAGALPPELEAALEPHAEDVDAMVAQFEAAAAQAQAEAQAQPGNEDVRPPKREPGGSA